MIAQFETDERVVTAALNIARDTDLPFSAHGDGARPWRVEVRGSLLHRQRLLAARPLPNRLVNGMPELSWHRSLDIARAERGAQIAPWWCRIDLVRSRSECVQASPSKDWMLLIDLVEKGARSNNRLGQSTSPAARCGGFRARVASRSCS
jgi:hypothetical protein